MHPSGAPVTKSHSSVPSGGTGVLRPPLPPAPTMLVWGGGGCGSVAIQSYLNGGEGRDIGEFGGVAVWDVVASEVEMVA